MRKSLLFLCGGNFDPKKCPSEYCFLDVDLCSSRLAYPYWSLKSLFCLQDPGSYSVVPSLHMNRFSVCKNTPKKSLNFDFWVSTKILSFEANFDPKKSCPWEYCLSKCGSKTIVGVSSVAEIFKNRNFIFLGFTVQSNCPIFSV